MSTVVCDFETANPECDLKEVGAWVYSEHILTEILCLCWSFNGGGPVAWTPARNRTGDAAALRDLASDPATIFIRHGDFEVAHWRNIMVKHYGFPDIPNERWHDTQAAAACKSLPLALEKLGPSLGLAFMKDMEGRKHTLGLSKYDKQGKLDRSNESIHRVVEYCFGDVEEEQELHNRLGFLPKDERLAFDMNQLMNQRGLRIDLDFVARAQEVVEKAKGPLLKRFKEITGFNPTQREKVLGWLWEQGAFLPDLKKETLAAVLGEEVDDDDEIGPDQVDPSAYDIRLSERAREALEIRQLVGSSSIKKLGRMALCVCEDGRTRGLSQYHGTTPGRSTGRLWNVYNLPRPTLGKLDNFGNKITPQSVVDAINTGDPGHVELQFGPAIQTAVSSLRHAIIPDNGNVFLSGDYVGIQARVVLALAGQFDKTALMASGADVYCDMAGQVFKRTITKEDKEERQLGKSSVLGLGFGLGWKQFKLKFNKAGTDEFNEEVVRIYRKEWAPKVPKLWYALRDATVAVVGKSKVAVEVYGIVFKLEDGWLTARLPSGRKLWYWNPRLVQLPTPWDPLEMQWQFCFDAMKQGRVQMVKAHGGLVTENITMAIECDIQRHGQVNCERNGFPIVLECYDELVAEVPESQADLEGFFQCMLDQPEWVKHIGIPVAVEGWQGDRYRK